MSPRLRINGPSSTNASAAIIVVLASVAAQNGYRVCEPVKIDFADELQTYRERSVKAEFERLSAAWQKATSHLSAPEDVAINEHYQRIIGMGGPAVPFILADLEREPKDWFWALHMITGESPFSPEDAGDIDAMSAGWISWGKSQGLLA